MRGQCLDSWRIQYRRLFKVKTMIMIARHKQHFEVGNTFNFSGKQNYVFTGEGFLQTRVTYT